MEGKYGLLRSYSRLFLRNEAETLKKGTRGTSRDEDEKRRKRANKRYFPAGTSFPGGVMVPLHARMVNLLPQMTVDKSNPWNNESLCSIQ